MLPEKTWTQEGRWGPRGAGGRMPQLCAGCLAGTRGSVQCKLGTWAEVRLVRLFRLTWHACIICRRRLP